MFISDTMNTKVITIDKEADLSAAHAKMAEYHIRHLPVVDEADFLIGIVTDRDLRSALPTGPFRPPATEKEAHAFSKLKVKDIMTTEVISLSPANTIGDALLLFKKHIVGALTVIDEQGRLKGIVSVRDLLRAFTNVLGIGEPGAFLGILVEDKIGQLKKIVDAITALNVSFGSVLVARAWEKDKRAVFPYLLTQNIAPVKRKLKELGYTLLDPMDWHLDQLPDKE
jgi:acetoin utilization protein AcuB